MNIWANRPRSSGQIGINARTSFDGGEIARVHRYLAALRLGGLTGDYRGLSELRTEGEGPPG
jgi:hypothetical protein